MKRLSVLSILVLSSCLGITSFCNASENDANTKVLNAIMSETEKEGEQKIEGSNSNTKVLNVVKPEKGEKQKVEETETETEAKVELVKEDLTKETKEILDNALKNFESSKNFLFKDNISFNIEYTIGETPYNVNYMVEKSGVYFKNDISYWTEDILIEGSPLNTSQMREYYEDATDPDNVKLYMYDGFTWWDITANVKNSLVKLSLEGLDIKDMKVTSTDTSYIFSGFCSMISNIGIDEEVFNVLETDLEVTKRGNKIANIKATMQEGNKVDIEKGSYLIKDFSEDISINKYNTNKKISIPKKVQNAEEYFGVDNVKGVTLDTVDYSFVVEKEVNIEDLDLSNVFEGSFDETNTIKDESNTYFFGFDIKNSAFDYVDITDNIIYTQSLDNVSIIAFFENTIKDVESDIKELLNQKEFYKEDESYDSVELGEIKPISIGDYKGYYFVEKVHSVDGISSVIYNVAIACGDKTLKMEISNIVNDDTEIVLDEDYFNNLIKNMKVMERVS